jgi:hypothetical protein
MEKLMARTAKRIVRRDWTRQDEKELKRHSKTRTPVKSISKAMKRTAGAVLLATLVPVDDVVVRIGPQCFPSLHWQGSGTGVFSRVDSKPIGSYNLEDRDYLIRTVAFEAGNEPSLGKAAVAHVVLNRKKSGRWGHQIKKIVTQP